MSSRNIIRSIYISPTKKEPDKLSDYRGYYSYLTRIEPKLPEDIPLKAIASGTVETL